MVPHLYITGVGSRETPTPILTEMTKIGAWCRTNGVRVRSGHADGADYAFECGALDHCDVYLPWATFNNGRVMQGNGIVVPFVHRFVEGDVLNELVASYHPAPHMLKHASWQLMRRNGPQVLGLDLKTPSKALVCWTKDGGPTGGTGQALRIAATYSIPIVNMFHTSYQTAEAVIAKLQELLSCQ